MDLSVSPNAEQAHFWGGDRGSAWVSHADRFDAQLEGYAEHLLAAACPEAGNQVLDIGCGAGITSLAAAHLVGGGGSVTGIDISATMLGLARQRAEALGVANAQFVLGDAQTMDPIDVPAEVVISRFGVMFFADPVAAFTNIAAMSAPRATLSFVCWGPVERNEWMAAPSMAVADLVELPPPAPSDAPGPFALADTQRVHDILADAGWVDVEIADVDDTLYLSGPGTVAEAVEFTMTASNLAGGLATIDDDGREMARVRLTDTLSPHHDGTGVAYPALARLVTARRP